MKSPIRRILSKSFLAAAAAITLVACSEEEGAAPLTPPDLAGCGALEVSDSLQLVSRVFATGVQVYRWNGAAWVLITPSATLFADEAGTHAVGNHYAGPTWEGFDGSKVVGSKLAECTPDAGAVAWLLLSGVATDAGGEFQGVTRIQRVNTTGGKAPAAGTVDGQVASVPYTTEYYFYAPR
jgi:hypothetical protein